MQRFLLLMLISVTTAFAQVSSLPVPTSLTDAAERSLVDGNVALNALPNLTPPMPKGRSTVIGGTINHVDPLRDQATVSVFGGNKVKIFFDGRTQVYRDGQPVSLQDLKDGERASLETLLDGTMIFARSIHILTRSIDGQCQGQVLSFDAASGDLRIRDPLWSEPLKLRLPKGLTILRQGQESSSSATLRPGALVEARFQPDSNHQGVVTSISILATPGTPFVFTGRLLFLNAGTLVLLDPRDQKRYEISFDSRSPVENLHEGDEVAVTAVFDGTRYSAKDIKLNAPPTP